MIIGKREYIVVDDGETWWWSPTAYYVKWAIVGSIFLLFFLWFVGGYYHARARIRKGLRPLAYHRFLVPRSQRYGPQGQPAYSYYQNGQPADPNQGYYGGNYGMNGYAEPPPVYNPDSPPTYQPPPGGSKVNPHQSHAPPARENPGSSATQ